MDGSVGEFRFGSSIKINQLLHKLVLTLGDN